MDKLHFGITFEGKLHDDFQLRLPTIGDNIGAVTDCSTINDLAVNVALLARCLESLGSIPKEKITYAFLRDNLPDDDYDVLWAALGDLKKKRLAQKSASSSSESLS